MLLYRTLRDRSEWDEIIGTRTLRGWYRDEECRHPVSEAAADVAGDDVYSDGGWNEPPSRYPALVHVETRACACGCGEPADAVALLLREQDRGTADALRWAESAVSGLRVAVPICAGHDEDGIDGYVTSQPTTH